VGKDRVIKEKKCELSNRTYVVTGIYYYNNNDNDNNNYNNNNHSYNQETDDKTRAKQQKSTLQDDIWRRKLATVASADRRISSHQSAVQTVVLKRTKKRSV
jgi:hypothetical protein